MSGAANAEEYQAFVPVLKVEPVIETRYEPNVRRVCSEPDDTAWEFSEVASTIGEDIRRQVRLWQKQRSCRTVTEQRAREQITGYRVTYRYGGETDTTRLSYDPGEQMRVNVTLSPIP
jgi:biotin-(acetyl-CoA carboxylase) ligase